MTSNRIILIDGNALVHRAYHALPSLTTKSGEVIGAVYGFTRILLNILKEYPSSHALVAFDLPGPTFRHIRYPEYKAHRPDTDPELIDQLGRVREVVQAFAIPIVDAEGFEADDIIGTWATHMEETYPDYQTIIVTGDKDLFQLVGDKTHLLYSRGKANGEKLFDSAGVQEKMGFGPEFVVDYKALRGDPSDNIPGVKGIGDKTAVQLIGQFGHLDEILRQAQDDNALPGTGIKPRVIQLLQEQKDMAYLSCELATIKTDVPIAFDLGLALIGQSDMGRVKALFAELGFSSLLREVPGLIGVPEIVSPSGKETQLSLFQLPRENNSDNLKLKIKNEKLEAEIREGAGAITPFQTAADQRIEIVDTEAKLDGLIAKIEAGHVLAFDTETTGLDPHQAGLVGISLSYQVGEGFYLPIGHTSGDNLPLATVAMKLGPLFSDPKIAKVAHHAKYDLLVLHYHGIEVQNLSFDTMLAAYLLNPGIRSYGLKALAFSELRLELAPLESLIGKNGKNQLHFSDLQVSDAASYAAMDAIATRELYDLFKARLENASRVQQTIPGARTMGEVFYAMELPLVPVLMGMELAGVSLDTDFLAKMSVVLGKRLIEIERAIYDAAGHTFNLNSPKQLGDVLFDQLGIKKTKRTKTGQYSTDADSLEGLKGEHVVIESILQYRELTKLKSTYVDALPPQVNPRTGRLHTSYNQTIAATGRLSSQNPNLQNIPIRTELGSQIRQAFVAKPGHVLLAADYSQMEFRILAHMAQDQPMVDAFRQGADFHTATAASVFDVYPEQVTKEQRRVAKIVNFGVIYGQSKYGLARQLSIPTEEAEHFINEFYQSYPGAKELMELFKLEAKTKGYVSTLLGRIRQIPDIRSNNVPLRQAAERMAMNMPIQGTAADIIKLAMIDTDKALRAANLSAQMILQVHDELVFEVPVDEVSKLAELVREAMENAFPLDVPLKVDVEVGENWGQMQPL